MINLVGKIDGVNLYTNELLEENKIISGHKQGTGNTFFVVHPNTARKLILGQRLEKIKKLKDRIINVTTI